MGAPCKTAAMPPHDKVIHPMFVECAQKREEVNLGQSRGEPIR